MKRSTILKLFLILLFITSLTTFGTSQNRSKNNYTDENAVLWESVDITQQNLFLGSGGMAMQPDLSNITFVRNGKKGYSKKYIIKDGSGNEWVAKVGLEAQSETAAVRLLSGIGERRKRRFPRHRLSLETLLYFLPSDSLCPRSGYSHISYQPFRRLPFHLLNCR